jgi:hypothetical protein
MKEVRLSGDEHATNDGGAREPRFDSIHRVSDRSSIPRAILDSPGTIA